MDSSYMLHEMCHNVLSKADIKAIGKNRGFSAQEIATPAMLSNFFLSPIGVEAALKSLNREEIAFLYFLKELNQEVSIAPFARIYGDAAKTKRYYGTFTQRYTETLRQVKKALVRKGLLLMAEAERGDTKMERWRFRFPAEFEAYLPPLLPDAVTLDTPGDFKEDAPRRKLLRIIKGRAIKLPCDSILDRWQIKDGVLYLGDQPYTIERMEVWHNACWEQSLPGKKRIWARYDIASDKAKLYSAIEATIYALSQLAPDAWASPQALAPVYKVFCDGDMPAADLCEAGWEQGRLVRQEAGGQMYYRLAPLLSEIASDLTPSSYLKSPNGRFLEIDLETIPYQTLADINQLALFEIIDKRLVAKPDFIRAGRAPATVHTSPLAQWLRENVIGFRQVFEELDKRRGKQIIHKDLMLARVKDLSLRIKIEKALGSKVISLDDEFIAFPAGLTSKVQRIVTQADFAVKERKAS